MAETQRGMLDDLAGDPRSLAFTQRLITALFGADDAFAAAMELRAV